MISPADTRVHITQPSTDAARRPCKRGSALWLITSQFATPGGQRLCHLHDQFSVSEYGIGVYNHPTIDRPIFDIADAGPIAGMRFDY